MRLMAAARGSSEDTPSAARPATVRVLIVEDEPTLLRALRINLRARGYEVMTAAIGRDGLLEAAKWPPDAVILDLGLPDLDGTQVVRELRRWSAAPVIVLSGRTGSGDKIAALESGANDYVTKPFSMEDLLARLRAALHREEAAQAGQAVRIGRCDVDLAARDVTRTGDAPEPVELTPTQWRILEILLGRPGQLVATRELLAKLWGPGAERSSADLRFHMAGLRQKLEEDPARPRHLVTEPGMGYRFQP